MAEALVLFGEAKISTMVWLPAVGPGVSLGWAMDELAAVGGKLLDGAVFVAAAEVVTIWVDCAATAATIINRVSTWKCIVGSK